MASNSAYPLPNAVGEASGEKRLWRLFLLRAILHKVSTENSSPG